MISPWDPKLISLYSRSSPFSGLCFLLEIASVFDELDESLPVHAVSLHWGYLVHLGNLKEW